MKTHKKNILIVGSHNSSCSLTDCVKNIVEKEHKSISEIRETFEFKNYYSPPPLIMNRSQRRKQEKLNRKKK